MSSTSPLTRRLLLGGLVLGLATVPGVGMGQVTQSDTGNQDGTSSSDPAPGPDTVTSREATSQVALGSLTVQTLGAIDFQPVGSVDYGYVSPGGVQVVSGGGTYFNAGLRLRVGARIKGITVYLDPNGSARTVTLNRYRPLNPTTFQELGGATSSAGSEVEAVTFALTHDVKAPWNYRIANVRLDVGGAILYGAKVSYRPPT